MLQELRMVTEDQELSLIVENSDLICSYFVILENSVVFITQQSDLIEANSGRVLYITLVISSIYQSVNLSLSLSLSVQ